MGKLDDQTNWALGFLRTAYKDYIAARVLLNKGYTIQGVMLASTAIEKSFKASICILTGKKIYGHLDKFENFKAIIEEKGYSKLIELIDSRFIDILTRAYELRYYDTVQTPTTIGFFKNQFLGELDSAFSIFERLYILNNEKGEKILTPLQMDLKQNNPDLMENNWLALKMEKKTFMETRCEGFAVYIHPNNVYSEINVSSQKMNLPYEGTMMLITVKPDNL
jgi:HEPN domain-containing protein